MCIRDRTMTTPPDEKFTDLIRKIMPFCDVLGLSVISATPQRVEATADWAEERTTVFGGLHGGYIMAIADSVGALCASQNLPEGAETSTIESKTNFLRPVTGGTVTIVATPIHVGRTTIVVQTAITRDDGKSVSLTTQTQAVTGPT